MFNTVLVPLDGSEYSERALSLGADVAKMSGSRLLLLTVILAYKDAHVPAVPKLDEQARQRAVAYLAPLAARAREKGLEVTEVVAHGEPAQEIIKAAKDGGAGLVVMKVLQTADSPVTMIRIPEGISR
jgi:nucleotide-binding universal stress UspA family protein